MVDDTFDRVNEARDGTIELVSSYLSNSSNRLSPEEVQQLIRDTFETLSNLSTGQNTEAEVEDFTKTKAEIKKSIGPEKLISFIDGKSYSSLKRHLTTNGYTPEQYRETFGLPSDYPLIHPAYSVRRSELAKSIGLGQKGRIAKVAASKTKPATKARKPKTTVTED